MNDLLTIRASALGGVFTRQDALECGYTDLGIRNLVRAGACRRLSRGVYGTPLLDPTAEDRHRQLVRALLRLYDGRAMASHYSALLLHGLPTHGVDLTRAHLTRLGTGHGRVRDAFSVHRHTLGTMAVEAMGLPAAPIALAAAQTATAWGSTAGVVAADAAIHRELITEKDLEQAARSVLPWSGSREAQVMAEVVDGRSESVGESRLRLIFHALRIPVEPQFRVTIGDDKRVIARADFRIRGTRLLIEFDGRVKYRGADGADAIAQEKQREDRVRRLGWDFERFVWEELDRPSFVAARVREGCRRAAA